MLCDCRGKAGRNVARWNGGPQVSRRRSESQFFAHVVGEACWCPRGQISRVIWQAESLRNVLAAVVVSAVF